MTESYACFHYLLYSRQRNLIYSLLPKFGGGVIEIISCLAQHSSSSAVCGYWSGVGVMVLCPMLGFPMAGLLLDFIPYAWAAWSWRSDVE